VEETMLFAAICLDQPDSFELRDRIRADHLAFIEASKTRVKLGGPFLDAQGRMNGSLLIVEAADEADARALLAHDPYANAGLFKSVELRGWRWTVGGPK
jgi:uncharacterized protein YciI